MRAPLLRMR